MKIYSSLEEIQTDLDTFIEFYNTERTHQGKRCKGRTPLTTFLDAVPLALEKQIDQPPALAATRMGPSSSSSESETEAAVDDQLTDNSESQIAG